MQAYAIANLDSSPDAQFLRRVEEAVAAGVDYLQLRGPDLTAGALSHAAKACAAAVQGSSTKFLVNRRADVAAATGADGVHLPAAGVSVAAVRRVSPFPIVGRSCHSVAECEAARAEGADYVLLGPLFDPRSKEGKGRVTLEDLRAAAALGIPVFALGGISRDNMQRLRGIPLQGIAAITLFMEDRPLAPLMEEIRAL
jgi:thiamine-phosphate pyrophosphorylase